MVEEVDLRVLSTEVSPLCFDKSEFNSENFSVDQFVSDHRKRVSLEKLRDDLGIYLRVLHSAMIELINKDYADFVNLSSNLVGMDKSIKSLVTPLGQLKEEILSVRSSLEDSLNLSRQKLKEKEDIKEKKMLLRRVIFIITTLTKVEALLGISVENQRIQSERELSGELVERISSEFVQIEFNLSQSLNLPIAEELQLRINVVGNILQNHLEKSFLEGVATSNVKSLRRILRIYATMGRTSEAEVIFCRKVVKPYMQDVITEKIIYGQGIKEMYNQVLDFIPTKCKSVLEITVGINRCDDVIKGYDFLINSIWPEVVTNLESIKPSIFAPGNPNLFHKHYSATTEFLEKFECHCLLQSVVKRLRSHSSYISFLEKWNLLVYFQIRFQEIGSAFETSLLAPFEECKGDSIFLLNATQCLWCSIQSCWSNSIFLPSLSYKFWKLTLQLLSRYSTWINNLINFEPHRSREESPVIESSMHQNTTSTHNNWDSKVLNSNIESTSSEDDSHPSISQLVMLVKDNENLLIQVPMYFKETIAGHLKTQGFDDIELIEAGLQENLTYLEILPVKLGTVIVKDIVSQCSYHLKLVTDIPRLYRKTNREVPSKPSSYVTNILKPLESFISSSQEALSPKWRTDWTEQVLNGITQQYLSVTGDVLTSVKKMEDSLKRLKRGRDKALSSQGSGGISDDDKIRLQLVLDVEHYGQKIESLNVKKENILHYDSLVELVEAARNSPSTAS